MSFRRVFSISRDYRKVTIWTANRRTGQLISTSASRAFPGLSREDRYANVKRTLSEFGLKTPPYVAAKTGK